MFRQSATAAAAANGSSAAAFLQPNSRNPGSSSPNLSGSGLGFYNQAGLARYRSAPSSFLAALLGSSTTDNNSSSGDESEAMFSALINNHHKTRMKQEADPEPRPGFRNGQIGGGAVAGGGGGGGAIVGSFSVGMDSQVHGCSNLIRQSSSPAGLFTGFSGMSNHMSFSSNPSLSSRFMPSIPENGNASWSGGSHFNGSSIKRNRDGEVKMFPGFGGLEQNQNVDSRKCSPVSAHHLSLPKSFAEAMDVEQKYLQFQQDTVPCQLRAKRGCATHPRSIAERMRRTRISERMKKLQDLFPNVDKQTNTADMLDLAVEYIKDLQKQVQTLTETRAKCVCGNHPWQTSPSS